MDSKNSNNSEALPKVQSHSGLRTQVSQSGSEIRQEVKVDWHELAARIHSKICNDLSPPDTRDLFTYIRHFFYHCAYVGWNGKKVTSFQSGDSTYCQWGHYNGYGAYTLDGKQLLERRELPEGKPDDQKYGLFLPDGTNVEQVSYYTSMIFLPYNPQMDYNPVKKSYDRLWDGSPPRLFWRRARCYFDRLSCQLELEKKERSHGLLLDIERSEIHSLQHRRKWEVDSPWVDDSDSHLFFVPRSDRVLAQNRFERFKRDLPGLVKETEKEILAGSSHQ